MKIKKMIGFGSMVLGGILMVIELSSKQKNYYVQSAGVIFLMLGLFLMNTQIQSKTEIKEKTFCDEEE